MSSAISEAKGIDLNTASREDLDRVGGLGRARVERLVQSRPFKSWDDLKKVEGFGGTLADDLKNAGASLGNNQ